MTTLPPGPEDPKPPTPLTREERAARRKTKLTSDQQVLVRLHLAMVDKIAGSMMQRGVVSCTRNDLRSLGYEGIVEAAQTFDPGKGLAFEGFAWARVEGAMKNGLKREITYQKRLAAAFVGACEYAEAHVDEGDPLYDSEEETNRRFDEGCDGFLAAMVLGYLRKSACAQGEQSVVDQECYARAMHAMAESVATLPERDGKIIRRHWFDEVALSELVQELGVSYATICRWHDGALKRLGARIRARGVIASPAL